jgi:hypothetical protein
LLPESPIELTPTYLEGNEMHAAHSNQCALAQGADNSAMGPVERSASMGIGVLLATAALRPRLLFDVGLVAAAGYLMYRGATGHCPVRERAVRRWTRRSSGADEFEALVGHSRPEPLPRRDAAADAAVDEASVESFPASDPPASTGATAAPTT